LFPVPPRIDRKNLKDITVKEGEPFFFDVKIIGEPAPEVEWMFGSKKIYDGNNRRIENVPNNSKLINSKPERKDSGIYKITATNKYGTDSAEVEVTVVCKYPVFAASFTTLGLD